MDTRDIAAVSASLRAATVRQLDACTDEQLETDALPGWTVADVYRHLLASDREIVLAKHLTDFLPQKDIDELEAGNDRSLEAYRHLSRDEIRAGLEVWGRRLRRIFTLTPGPLARLRAPILFGRLPLWWLATLRPYDEWIHQHDVASALGQPEPPMDLPTRRILGRFLLVGVAGSTLPTVKGQEGVIEFRLTDIEMRPYRYDLGRNRAGNDLDGPPDAVVTLDVPSFCLAASERRSWDEAGSVEITGDRAVADRLLDAIRIV